MQSLVPLLRTMVESCTKGLEDGDGFENEKARVWGVVIDFMSLPQRGYTSGYVPDEMGPDGKVIKSNDDRTPYQLARFGGGLSAYTGFQPAPLTSSIPCLCRPLRGAHSTPTLAARTCTVNSSRRWPLSSRPLPLRRASTRAAASACFGSARHRPTSNRPTAHTRAHPLNDPLGGLTCQRLRLSPSYASLPQKNLDGVDDRSEEFIARFKRALSGLNACVHAMLQPARPSPLASTCLSSPLRGACIRISPGGTVT